MAKQSFDTEIRILNLISHLKQEKHQFELRGKEMERMQKDRWTSRFHKTEVQSYLTTNVYCSSRQEQHNPEGDSGIIRAPSLVSKGETVTSVSSNQMASAQSYGGGTAQTWGSHPSLAKLWGQNYHSSVSTSWNFSPLHLEDRILAPARPRGQSIKPNN